MIKLSPQELVEILKQTLTNNNVAYQKIIDDFGQIAAVEKRERGEEFTLQDHVRGLILATLSNQRSWGPIAKNLSKITEIFHNFNPDELEKVNPKILHQKITAIGCGNRSIGKQLIVLSENIKKLRYIEKEFGSIDKFVASKPAEEIAELLAHPTSAYKLKQIGVALGMEYLRNVGIRGAKPDLHILRICGSERLRIFPQGTTPKQAIAIFRDFAKEANINSSYLDNLLWIFGAQDYANICSAKPKCRICGLRENCNYLKS